MQNSKAAVRNIYRSFVFNNYGDKPILILEVFKGRKVSSYHSEIPHWGGSIFIKL